jgi:hypothetical protein
MFLFQSFHTSILQSVPQCSKTTQTIQVMTYLYHSLPKSRAATSPAIAPVRSLLSPFRAHLNQVPQEPLQRPLCLVPNLYRLDETRFCLQRMSFIARALSNPEENGTWPIGTMLVPSNRDEKLSTVSIKHSVCSRSARTIPRWRDSCSSCCWWKGQEEAHSGSRGEQSRKAYECMDIEDLRKAEDNWMKAIRHDYAC